MHQNLLNVLVLVPVFLFSLCVHEFAHAWVAYLRGDSTARDVGRLTLHPLAHADMLGTLILPILCVYMGAPFFGWAKPVPVDIRNLKYGRRDMALVAFAGPLANVVLGLAATGLLAILLRLPLDHSVLETLQVFTVISIQVNLMLAFFNLIPIPPLDGFNVLHGILPRAAAVRAQFLFRYAGLLLVILLVTGAFRYIAIPVHFCFRYLLGLAGA